MNFYLPLIVSIVLCNFLWTATADNLTPTVHPADRFDAISDAQFLRNAAGFNTDKSGIINLLTHRTIAQRLSIAKHFEIMNKRELKSMLRPLFYREPEPLRNDITALITPLPEYYAEALHEATWHWGTDEAAIIEILAPLNNTEVKAISVVYKKLYGTQLKDDLEDDTSGDFQKLVVSLCSASLPAVYRLPIQVIKDIENVQVTNDFEALVAMGEGHWGTNKGPLNAILTTRSYPQLRRIFERYETRTGRTIEEAIKGEFGGWACEAYLAIVKCARDKSAYFAERLNAAMAGPGTTESSLTRIILGRSEIDLGDIKQSYQRIYGRSLVSDIEDDTFGDYQKLLLNLVGR